jgi:hypothetical protein
MVDREELRKALDIVAEWKPRGWLFKEASAAFFVMRAAAREYLALLDADVLIIEKVDEEWPEWAVKTIQDWSVAIFPDEGNWFGVADEAVDALDALKAAKDG